MALGHNISRIIITIYFHKLGHFLCLGFPSAMIIENVILTLEFTSRHDSQIKNKTLLPNINEASDPLTICIGTPRQHRVL